VPRIMARVWLQEPDGLRPVVLLDPAHPALQALEAARTQRHPDPRQAALGVAAALEDAGWPEAATRAQFIRHQCAGERADGLFATDRERWGIPDYREDLVLATDFRHGFLWHFRDHSTASSDNQQAKTWFLCSPEARFVQAYDFEGSLEGEGPYKGLLERDVAWGLPGSLEVLDNPVFTLEDYRRFASDPAFTKAQETLRWCLRDSYAHQATWDDYLVLPESRPEVLMVCDLARLSLYQGALTRPRATWTRRSGWIRPIGEPGTTWGSPAPSADSATAPPRRSGRPQRVCSPASVIPLGPGTGSTWSPSSCRSTARRSSVLGRRPWRQSCRLNRQLRRRVPSRTVGHRATPRAKHASVPLCRSVRCHRGARPVRIRR
jgi:hypothetical protein